MYSISIYCPDAHLKYDRTTLDEKGVGGGVTARVRMAYALARGGHAVRLYVNCPRERSERGVETCHFSNLKKDRSDVFIASTSGGGLDLSPLEKADLGDSLKILFVHGTDRPKGLEGFPFDYVYAPSNFVRRIAVSEWGVPRDRLFTSYHGVCEENFIPPWRRPPQRDPYTLVYIGHPSKGLETAIAIFQLLKQKEKRFSLHVYGGAGLWGQADGPAVALPVEDHGLVGQRALARRLQTYGFSLNLQDRLEPFGMAVIESMRAGCLVLASPVGAYPEIVTHGRNGFLVPGNHLEEETRRKAADLILALLENPDYAEWVRQHAVHTPLSWEQVARTWMGHWDWFRSGKTTPAVPGLEPCPECQGAWLALADGLHCTRCGSYRREPPSLHAK